MPLLQAARAPAPARPPRRAGDSPAAAAEPAGPAGSDESDASRLESRLSGRRSKAGSLLDVSGCAAGRGRGKRDARLSLHVAFAFAAEPLGIGCIPYRPPSTTALLAATPSASASWAAPAAPRARRPPASCTRCSPQRRTSFTTAGALRGQAGPQQGMRLRLRLQGCDAMRRQPALLAHELPSAHCLWPPHCSSALLQAGRVPGGAGAAAPAGAGGERQVCGSEPGAVQGRGHHLAPPLQRLLCVQPAGETRWHTGEGRGRPPQAAPVPSGGVLLPADALRPPPCPRAAAAATRRRASPPCAAAARCAGALCAAGRVRGCSLPVCLPLLGPRLVCDCQASLN